MPVQAHHTFQSAATATGNGTALRVRGGDLVVVDVVISNTATVVAEFADALADFLAGRNEAAAVSLLALREQFDRVGGSAAQQEIVEETAIAALAAAGRSREATALLEERMDRRPRPRDESWRVGILVHSD